MVRGLYTPFYTGSYTTSQVSDVHFQPAQLFRPGEEIYAQAIPGILAADGIELTPYGWHFVAGVAPGSGVLTDGGQLLSQRNSCETALGDVASADSHLGDLDGDGLAEVWPYFRHHQRVVVLGDAEFSNEPVINWLRQVNWDFVFRFQHRYQL